MCDTWYGCKDHGVSPPRVEGVVDLVVRGKGAVLEIIRPRCAKFRSPDRMPHHLYVHEARSPRAARTPWLSSDGHLCGPYFPVSYSRLRAVPLQKSFLLPLDAASDISVA